MTALLLIAAPPLVAALIVFAGGRRSFQSAREVLLSEGADMGKAGK